MQLWLSRQLLEVGAVCGKAARTGSVRGAHSNMCPYRDQRDHVPSLPEHDGLGIFGIPFLALTLVGKATWQSGDFIRIAALGVTLVAALLGAIGMLPDQIEHRCMQEWLGLALSGIALCICSLRLRGRNRAKGFVLCAAIYLTFAWGLLVTGCRKG